MVRDRKIGPDLRQALTGDSSPYVQPITMQSIGDIPFHDLRAKQVHLVIGRGLVGPQHVSQGVPWEVLEHVCDAISLCKSCGIPFPNIHVLIGLEIALANPAIQPRDIPDLQKVAAWHLAAMSRLNEVCKQSEYGEVSVMLDRSLMFDPHWDKILAYVRAEMPRMREYAIVQTALIKSLYDRLTNDDPDSVLFKVGATNHRNLGQLRRRRLYNALRVDADDSRGVCEAVFDHFVRQLFPDAAIGFYYVSFPVGPDSAHKFVSPYVVGEPGRLFLNRAQDFPEAVLDTYPDLPRKKPGKTRTMSQLRAHADLLTTTYDQTSRIAEAFPTLFPDDQQLGAEYIQLVNARAVLREAREIVLEHGASHRHFLTGLDDDNRQVLEGYCRHLAHLVRARIATIRSVFAPSLREIQKFGEQLKAG